MQSGLPVDDQSNHESDKRFRDRNVSNLVEIERMP